MNARHCFSIAAAVGALAGCATTSPYYYDPYYGYYPVVYDDYYYDYAMMGGYYYYPGYYYYYARSGAAPQAAAVTDVPPAVRLLLLRWNVTVDPGCLTVTKTADADNDGIDADETVTFACDSTPAGGTARVTGSVNLKDLDDNDATAGYTLSFDAFTIRVTASNGAVTQRAFTGTETAAKADNGIHTTRETTVDGIDTYPDNVQRASKLEMKADGTFAAEIVPGSKLITRGTVTLSGQGTFTGPDGASLTITRQTDPTLHWNGDCAREAKTQGFDGGAIVYQSSQGRETRIVHNSCTVVTVTNRTVPVQ